MAERLRFAGFEAAIGPIVIGLFALPALLGTVGMGILLGTGEVAATPTSVVGYVLLVAATIALLLVIVRDLRRFRTLEIGDDRSWTMRNPWGFVLMRLASTDKRAVDRMNADVWMFIGTALRGRRSWIQIETPDGRILKSTISTPEYQTRAIEALDRHIAGG